MKNFKIFYIRQSAVLPSDEEDKEWREIQHIRWLHDAGFHVRLICSSYDHYKKKQRTPLTLLMDRVIPLWSPGYKNNKSIFRFFDAWFFSISLFFYLLRNVSPQDKIICSYPTPESSLICRIVALIKGCPVLLDFRDAWPDAFGVSGLKKSIFSIYINILLKATLLGPRKPAALFMSNGLKLYYEKSIRKPIEGMVISNTAPSITRSNHPNDSRSSIVFAGTLNSQFIFTPLLDLNNDNNLLCDIFIIGDGENKRSIEKILENVPNVKFLGRLPYADTLKYLQRAKAMFMFYDNPAIFEDHITNKVSEALLLGLPLITNLKSSKFTIDGKMYLVGESIRNESISKLFCRSYVFNNIAPAFENILSERSIKNLYLTYIESL